jgi:RNA polymerase sigma-70 factor (ECF subfamily)
MAGRARNPRRRGIITEKATPGPRMPPIGPDELGRLYREHAPALRLFARQWPGVADDVVQDAFVKLAQQVRPPNDVRAWLYRVVRNAALSAARAEGRRRRRDAVAGSRSDWFAVAEDRLEAEDAARLLADLPLEQREAVVARVWGGLKFEEIAQLVGGSVATVYRRYQAGLATLRERLEGRWTRTPCPPTT